uniref:ANAPC4_WD40 domain-containing protein n=1 Tax=Heterorhabditis bacteriophora TaxID=37862 RepID=A0A1I7XFY5_HETBA
MSQNLFDSLDQTDPHVVLANSFIFNLHEEDYIFSPSDLSAIHRLLTFMVDKYDRHMAKNKFNGVSTEDHMTAQDNNSRDSHNDDTQSVHVMINQKSVNFNEVPYNIKTTGNNSATLVAVHSPSSSCINSNIANEWTGIAEMTLGEQGSENQGINTNLSLTLISDDSMGVVMKGQPLGACFDEVAKQWIIADSRSNRLLMIPSMESIHHEWIKQPSALCILKEGVSIAALCAEYIQSYQYGNKELCVIAERLGKTCREVIWKHIGNQQVTMAFVDDTDASNVIVRIEHIHRQEWDGNGEPNGGFQFVSGIQLDSEGYSLIADASGRTIQLFDNKLKFCSRVSTDFNLPYTSAMVVNSMGEVLLCDRKQSKLYCAHLLATEKVIPLEERINRSTHRQFGFRGRGRELFKVARFSRISFTEKSQDLEDRSGSDVDSYSLFNEKNVVKGLNFVALNGSTGDIESSVAFDVSTSDEKLITWLRTLPTSSVVIGVSFGDVAERISTDARTALTSYGAVHINEWRGGYSYAIVGRQGLKSQARELLIPQNSMGHMIVGCFDLPLGDIGSVNMTEEHLGGVQRIDQEQMANLGGFKGIEKTIELGEQWKWCGMEVPCKKDEIALHFFSGEHKDDWPKMCVDGHMVFDRDLNGAGRGLNMAAIEPKTKRISAAANFDTYEDETTRVEEWLDAVALGDIVAVVSFDEASTMLNNRMNFFRISFIAEDRIDDPIRPRPLANQDRRGDPMFNTPILIVAGLSTDSLRLSLESLMNQEGLNTQMVIVTYDKEYAENAALATLFHVKSVAMNVTNGYNCKYESINIVLVLL